MKREDLQWWIGAVGAMLAAFAAFATLPHPIDGYVAGAAAACGAFAFYKITPTGSVKQ